MFKIEGNIVVNGIVCSSNTWCSEIFPNELWIEGFMNNEPRRYPCIGWTFEPTANIGFGEFIRPKPYDSWILNSSWEWEAPVPRPNDGNTYIWDENSTTWSLIE